MTLDELQKKITPPSGWHLGLEEDFNADGIKENVAVVYDDANCGVELFRTPTHSTPPDDGEIDEDANNHIKYAVHCAKHFGQIVEALDRVYRTALISNGENPVSRDWLIQHCDAVLKSAQEVEGI